jgi:hypothetical protein
MHQSCLLLRRLLDSRKITLPLHYYYVANSPIPGVPQSRIRFSQVRSRPARDGHAIGGDLAQWSGALVVTPPGKYMDLIKNRIYHDIPNLYQFMILPCIHQKLIRQTMANPYVLWSRVGCEAFDASIGHKMSKVYRGTVIPRWMGTSDGQYYSEMGWLCTTRTTFWPYGTKSNWRTGNLHTQYKAI